jgi:acetolactate synthase-1/3 small subunit
MMQSDHAAAERAVQHLQKVVGVHDAAVIPQGDAVARELALVKLRPSAEQYAELLDVVQLYHATLVDESLDAVVLELTGSEAFVLSCLRALERFEIVEIARSGAVAMESGTAELRFGAQPQLEAGAR